MKWGAASLPRLFSSISFQAWAAVYTSEQNSQLDRAAMAARFVIPIVVNGRVFGTRSEVEVYGLLK